MISNFVKAALAALLLALVCLAAPAAAPRPRLVSLAPSLTEMVFDLGAGDRLVGVTAHCVYPPEARAIARVGDYQTPSLEAILSLRPDLVLALGEHGPVLPRLDELGLASAVFDHRSADGLLDSLLRLGDICGAPDAAATLHGELAAAFAVPAGGPAGPRVLFLIGRDYGAGGIANAYAVGQDGLYDRLLAAAGCRNAYDGGLAYPVLSGEGVAALNPDIIVEAMYGDMGSGLPADALRRDWQPLANLPAVRDGRLHRLDANYVFVPGMRLLLLKRDIEALVRADSGP